MVDLRRHGLDRVGVPDGLHLRERTAHERDPPGHLVARAGTWRRWASVSSDGRHADADHRYGGPGAGKVVERALDLLDHERAGVVAQRVDEGQHDDVAAVLRTASPDARSGRAARNWLRAARVASSGRRTSSELSAARPALSEERLLISTTPIAASSETRTSSSSAATASRSSSAILARAGSVDPGSAHHARVARASSAPAAGRRTVRAARTRPAIRCISLPVRVLIAYTEAS